MEMVHTTHLPQSTQTLDQNEMFHLIEQNPPLRLYPSEFQSLFRCLHKLPGHQAITHRYIPVLAVEIICL